MGLKTKRIKFDKGSSVFKQKGKHLGPGKGCAVNARSLAHMWFSAAVPEYNGTLKPALSIFWNNLKQQQPLQVLEGN